MPRIADSGTNRTTSTTNHVAAPTTEPTHVAAPRERTVPAGTRTDATATIAVVHQPDPSTTALSGSREASSSTARASESLQCPCRPDERASITSPATGSGRPSSGAGINAPRRGGPARRGR